jgi:hypothetical protein
LAVNLEAHARRSIGQNDNPQKKAATLARGGLKFESPSRQRE